MCFLGFEARCKLDVLKDDPNLIYEIAVSDEESSSEGSGGVDESGSDSDSIESLSNACIVPSPHGKRGGKADCSKGDCCDYYALQHAYNECGGSVLLKSVA